MVLIIIATVITKRPRTQC